MKPSQVCTVLAMVLLVPQMAQPPRSPDLEAQRTAMRKLEFLVGTWTGEARITRGAGETTELVQTEEAGYKLDGLILVIEGIGSTRSGVAPVLQAFGVISYEDETKTYRMLAFNDGRFLEANVKLLEGGKGMVWGFVLGEIKTKSVMRINEKDEWTELREIIISSHPPKRFMEVAVRRQK
jgi:hypothetical protein